MIHSLKRFHKGKDDKGINWNRTKNFCINNTPPTIITIEKSRKSDNIVEARASIIELASLKREITSPVRLVAKKRHWEFKDMSYVGQDNVNGQSLTQYG